MNLAETVRSTASILDRRTKRTLAIATIASILMSLFDTMAIALILPLVSLAGTGEDSSGLGGVVSGLVGTTDARTLVLVMTVVVVALFILKDLGGLAYTWWLTSFKVVKRVELSTQLLSQIMRAPYTAVSRRSSGEMLRTVNDAVLQFYGTTVFGLMTLVSNVTSIVAIAVALLVSAPLPSIILAVYFGGAAIFYLHVMKPRAQQAGQVSAEAASVAYRTALAALGGLKEAKLRGSEGFFVDSYRNAALRGAYAGRTAGFISAAPRYLLEILFILAVGGGMLLGGTQLGAGHDQGGTLGVLAVFVAGGLRALPAVTSLLGQLNNIRFGSRYLDIILDEVRQLDGLDTPKSGTSKQSLTSFDQVRLEAVSFRYPAASRDAITNVSLEIPRGTSLALVGGSGAGKTTLVDLILGLHLPSEGRITAGGYDLRTVMSGWQRGIGYVPQEVFLREATLAENVAFDQPADRIDHDRLMKAIEQAQLGDLVAELEDGVETPVGERGSRLSGGQRQRVGIARALYQNPRLLVFDEATSALDNDTEHKVNEAIRQLHGSLTIVIVAHRLSTVRNVDRVVLLHEGRIEATGTFDEVRRLSARFDRMVRLGSLS